MSYSPEQAVEQGVAALKTRNPETALPALQAAIERAPQDGRLWHLTGLIHRAKERRDLALPALERAAKLLPGHPMVAHGLARTRFEAGLPSVDAYARALRLSPGNQEMLKGLVAALVAERRPEEAMQGLERALSGNPLWYEGHGLLTDLRWLHGHREDFARSFAQALIRHPRDLELRRQQIISLMHAKQYEAVLAAIDDGRRALGEHSIFAANEAIVFAEIGDREKADARFAPLEGLRDHSLQIRRVRHLLRWGRVEQASHLIEDWLQSPQAFAFWPYAAAAWRMTGDPRSEWLEGDERLVGIYDIADRLPPLDQLAETLRDLHTLSGQPLAQSLRGGTQTDGNLFQRIDPVIVQLREAILQTVAEHAASLPPHDASHPTLREQRSPIAFAGAWSVRLREGGFHANHVHPMGWISSALYVALPPDLGQGNDSGWLTLGEPYDPTFPIDLPPRRMVEPRPARLVLFPSWMWHGTRPFGQGERLTVAFDVAVPQS